MSETLLNEIDAFEKAHPLIKWVDLFAANISGRLVGKRLPFGNLKKVAKEGFRLPVASVVTDCHGEPHMAAGFSHDADGDAEFQCALIDGSLKLVPWAKTPTAQVMYTIMRGSEGFEGLPRNILQRVVKRFEKLGIKPVIATELEFYIVDQAWRQTGIPTPPRSPRTGRQLSGYPSLDIANLDDFRELFDRIHTIASVQGVPTDAILSEYGPGQFEVNLRHRDDCLRAADDGVLLKRIIKSAAEEAGYDATFMAKLYSEHAGNGLHVHVSLVDDQGKNIFETKDGSKTLMRAVDGMIASMPDMIAVFAPCANSYRRLGRTPMAPQRATWAENNRNAAVRIIREGPGSTRFEHRVAGADANVYLTVATILAGVLYGLTETVPSTKPLSILNYTDDQPKLPASWPEAISKFQSSTALRPYLGDDFCQILSAIRLAEFEKYQSIIPPHDYAYYFDTR